MNIIISIIGVAAFITGILLLAYDLKENIGKALIPIGLILTMFGFSFTILPTGYTGVRVTFGQVSNSNISAGFNWKVPFVQSIKLINNKQQDIVFHDQIWGETEEKTPVYASEITVSYKISSEKASWLYTNVSNLDYIISTDLINSAIKSAMADLTYDKVTVRSVIEPKVKNYLETALIEKYEENTVLIQKVTITQMDFEESYNQAIAAKSLALQEQERQKIVNDTAIAKAEANAQVILTNTQAEAQAKIISAQADAQANELLTESLDENILKSKLYDKWDGKLPTVTGDSTTLINSKDFLE